MTMLVTPPLPDALPGIGEDTGNVEEIHAAVLAQAEAGDATAQQQLGVMYHRGVPEAGIEPDHVAAALWFSKAAEAGLASAQCNLGLLHLLGHGVPTDDRLAASWLSRAADAGVAPAQNHYGRLLQEGRGVPKDLTLAVQYFQKAADQGEADAMVNLGAACLVGRGMQKDESKARSLLQVAADRGDQDAAQLLSVLDSQGGGELQKTPASSPEPTPQELAERRRKIEYAEAQAQALLREEAELAEKENNTQKPKKKKKKKGKTQAPADDAPPTNLNVPMRPMRPSAMPGLRPAEKSSTTRDDDELDDVPSEKRKRRKKPKKKPVDESALAKAKALSEETKPVTDDAVRDLVARLEHDDPCERPLGACNFEFDVDVLAEASRRGHARAMYWYAQFMLKKACSQEPSLGASAEKLQSLGVSWLKAACEQGHGQAQCHLGSIFSSGFSVPRLPGDFRPVPYPRDVDQAEKLLHQGAIATDDAPTMWCLARLLLQRAISTKSVDDGQKGALWAERAGKAGVPDALARVARIYLGGSDGAEPVPGVKTDYQKAKTLAEQALKSGSGQTDALKKIVQDAERGLASSFSFERRTSSSAGSSDFAPRFGSEPQESLAQILQKHKAQTQKKRGLPGGLSGGLVDDDDPVCPLVEKPEKDPLQLVEDFGKSVMQQAKPQTADDRRRAKIRQRREEARSKARPSAAELSKRGAAAEAAAAELLGELDAADSSSKKPKKRKKKPAKKNEKAPREAPPRAPVALPLVDSDESDDESLELLLAPAPPKKQLSADAPAFVPPGAVEAEPEESGVAESKDDEDGGVSESKGGDEAAVGYEESKGGEPEYDVDMDAAYALELDRAEHAQPPQPPAEEEWVTSTSRRRKKGGNGKKKNG